MESKNLGSVVIDIILNSAQFKKQLSEAQQDLENARKNMEESIQKLSKLRSVTNALGNSLLGVGAAMTGFAGVLIKNAADIEDRFGRLQTVLDMTSDEFYKLKELALEVSSAHLQSADEIAESFYNMASAGMNFNQIMASTEKIAVLATATLGTFEQAVDVFTDTLNVYGKTWEGVLTEEEQATKIMNTLAGTVQKFKTTLPEMQIALSRAAGVAAQAGISFEELNTALGILQSNGQEAERAGTGLRNILVRLQVNAKELGVSIYDSSGKLRSLADIFDDIKKSLESYTDANQKAAMMAKIFGEETITYANILMNNTDVLREQAKTVSELVDAYDMAAYREQTLSGQLKILRNNFENLTAALGELLIPFMKELTAAIKGLADWFNKLSPSTKELLAKLTAFGGIAALVSGGVLKIVAAFMKFREIQMAIKLSEMASGMMKLGLSSSQAAEGVKTLVKGFMNIKTLGAVGAISALIVVIQQLARTMSEAGKEAKEMFKEYQKGAQDTITYLSEQVKKQENLFQKTERVLADLFTGGGYSKAQGIELFERRNIEVLNTLTSFRDRLIELKKAGFENTEEFKKLKKEFEDYLKGIKQIVKESGSLENAFGNSAKVIATEVELIGKFIAEGDKATETVQQLTADLYDVGESAFDTKKKMEELHKSFQNLQGRMPELLKSEDLNQINEALEQAKKMRQEFKDETVEAKMLDIIISQLATRFGELATSQKTVTDSTKTVSTEFQKMMDNYQQNLKYIETLAQVTGDQQEALNAKLNLQKQTLQELTKQYVAGNVSQKEFAKASQELADSIKETEEELKKYGGTLEGVSKLHEEFKNIFEGIGETINKNVELAKTLGEGYDEVSIQLNVYKDALTQLIQKKYEIGELTEEEQKMIDEVSKKYSELKKKQEERLNLLQEQENALKNLQNIYSEYLGNLESVGEQMNSFTASTEEYFDQFAELKTRYEDLSKTFENLSKKLEELEKKKGTPEWNEEEYNSILKALEQTGAKIDDLSKSFVELSKKSDLFSGIMSELDMALKKNQTSFEVWGDELKKLEGDIEAYRKAIEELIDKKVKFGLTKEEEQSLERLQTSLKLTEARYATLAEQYQKNAEAAKKFRDIQDDLVSSLELASARYKVFGDNLELLTGQAEAYKKAVDEMIKVSSERDLTEEERRYFDRLLMLYQETEKAIERIKKERELEARATEEYTDTIKELNKALGEIETKYKGQGKTLAEVRERYDAITEAIKRLETIEGPLTIEQIKRIGELRNEQRVLADKIERMSRGFEEFQRIQESISEIDFRIENIEDATIKIELLKQKLEKLNEESQIVVNLAISKEEMEKELSRIQKETQAVQKAIADTYSDIVEEQIKNIGSLSEETTTEVLQKLRKLLAEYQKQFAEGVIDEKIFQNISKRIGIEIQNVNKDLIRQFDDLKKKYVEKSPLEELRKGIDKDLKFIDSLYKEGIISLADFMEAREMILKKSSQEEEKILEGIREKFAEAIGGNSRELYKNLQSLKTGLTEALKAIDDYAEMYAANVDELLAKREEVFKEYFKDAGDAFKNFIFSEIEGLFDFFNAVDQKAKDYAAKHLMETYGSIDNIYQEIVSKLENLKRLGLIDDEQFRVGMEKAKEIYGQFADYIETNPVIVRVNLSEFSKQMQKISEEFGNWGSQIESLANAIDSDLLRSLADVLKLTGEISNSLSNVGSGISSILGGNIFGGIGQIASGILSIFTSVFNFLKKLEPQLSNFEKRLAGRYAETRGSFAEIFDIKKLSKELGYGLPKFFLGRSKIEKAYKEVFGEAIKQIQQYSEGLWDLSDRYSQLAKEAEKAGKITRKEFFETASKKLDEYAKKLGKLESEAEKYAGRAKYAGRLKGIGAQIDQVIKEAEALKNFTNRGKEALDLLKEYGLEGSVFANELDKLYQKATEAMEKGIGVEKISQDMDKFKDLIAAIGPTLKELSVTFKDLGAAAGKYQRQVDELTEAYLNGKITQEEYISQLENLSDTLQPLAKQHKELTEAINKTGTASVFLNKKLDDLDQQFADGLITSEEYSEKLDEMIELAKEVAKTHDNIRNAIQKIGEPVQFLKDRFDELNREFSEGLITEEEYRRELERLNDKAYIISNTMDRFNNSLDKINQSLGDYAFGDRFEQEFEQIKQAFENGEITFEDFINQLNNLSYTAEEFMRTFDNVKQSIASGLKSAIQEYVTFEWSDSMLPDMKEFVEKTTGQVYESLDSFKEAWNKMGEEAQQALIDQFKYEKFKEKMDATIKQAILDSLIEGVMAQSVLQDKINELAAFIAAAMKDGLSQGEIDAIKTMMGELNDLAAGIADTIAETWANVNGEIKTSSEEIQRIIEETLRGIKQTGEETSEVLEDTTAGVADDVFEPFEDLPLKFGETIKSTKENIINEMEEIPAVTAEKTNEAVQKVEEQVSSSLNAIQQSTEQVNENISKIKSRLQELNLSDEQMQKIEEFVVRSTEIYQSIFGIYKEMSADLLSFMLEEAKNYTEEVLKHVETLALNSEERIFTLLDESEKKIREFSSGVSAEFDEAMNQIVMKAVNTAARIKNAFVDALNEVSKKLDNISNKMLQISNKGITIGAKVLTPELNLTKIPETVVNQPVKNENKVINIQPGAIRVEGAGNPEEVANAVIRKIERELDTATRSIPNVMP